MPVLPSYRSQSIDLMCKSNDWLLYEGNTVIQWYKVVPIISVLSIAFEKVLDFVFFQKINSDCFYFFTIGFRTSLYYRVQTNITCDEKYTHVF